MVELAGDGRAFARFLLPVLVAVAVSPADAQQPPPARIPLHLEVEAPGPGERIRRAVALVEVKGRAGRAALFASDIVIAIDRSSSSLLASGIDVDGDGVVGRNRLWANESGRFAKPHRSWTTDQDDTVLSAEIGIARALVDGLAARRNRLGVLTFTSSSTLRAAVGEPHDARAALEAIDVGELEADLGTDLARALELGGQMLRAAPVPSGPDRPRAILLLTDGNPTAPDGAHWAGRRALQRARELGDAGIAIWAIALGPRADADYLYELAASTGGGLVPVDALPLLIDEPRLRSLRPEEVVIENLTTGERARAVRLLPDGGFDGFVPLTAGENTLQIEAVLADGLRASNRLSVHYERPVPETETDRRNAARLLVELRRRTEAIDAD